MRILLVGEYSRVHNSLKEGLIALGHDVTLLADSDGFKNYPADITISRKTTGSFFYKLRRSIWRSLSGNDLADDVLWLRFRESLKNLEQFDVVQLINSVPFAAHPRIEKKIIQELISKCNGNLYLLNAGEDTAVIDYYLSSDESINFMQPFKVDASLGKVYSSSLKYVNKSHRLHYKWLENNVKGIIPLDLEYDRALQTSAKKYLHIPAPVNIDKHRHTPVEISDRVHIFMGVNPSNYHRKGIVYFEKSLLKIKEQYGDRVKITRAEGLPYEEYLKKFKEAHIILDQCLAHDQGTNAREAMAQGKVVVSGAGVDFITHYNLSSLPLIPGKPDIEYLIKELSFLIENPDTIILKSREARAFIEKHHNYKEVASKYLNQWKS